MFVRVKLRIKSDSVRGIIVNRGGAEHTVLLNLR